MAIIMKDNEDLVKWMDMVNIVKKILIIILEIFSLIKSMDMVKKFF